MSLTRLFAILFIPLLVSCSLFDSGKSDREKAGLKGKVKTLTEYEGVVESDNLVQGKIICRTTFDERGNQTNVELFNEEGNIYQKRNTEFDENNHKTISQVYDEEGALERTLVFSYNENGYMTECEDFNGRGILMYRANNTYDEFGRLTENLITTSDGKFISKTTMAYDEFGNDTLLTTFSDQSTVSQKEYRDYDANGNVSELNVYDSLDMHLSLLRRRFWTSTFPKGCRSRRTSAFPPFPAER